ncbi:hypothetical protein I2486_19935 [Cellulophaga sp. E16_2]|uniref:hypothetical protein n=1 Tax=Cellulophaga sp. E16_2 TaxID=2789297 RepID=UPI001A927534|nr:hypothetical protein [Cellulophaga sp. E16_2]MBO0593676.1 hypothetical protein [Cellulophaga sp. E16_2]
MKKTLLIALLAITVLACKEKPTPEPKVELVAIEDLTPSPAGSSYLTETQLAHIKRIHQTFEEVYPISLEETIKNFKRDLHPDNEINIWLAMTNAYEPYAAEHTGAEKLEYRKEAYKLILMRTMMPDKEAISNAHLKILSGTEAQAILTNYKLNATPIKVKTNE